jgi:hypothetical protein
LPEGGALHVANLFFLWMSMGDLDIFGISGIICKLVKKGNYPNIYSQTTQVSELL